MGVVTGAEDQPVRGDAAAVVGVEQRVGVLAADRALFGEEGPGRLLRPARAVLDVPDRRFRGRGALGVVALDDHLDHRPPHSAAHLQVGDGVRVGRLIERGGLVAGGTAVVVRTQAGVDHFLQHRPREVARRAGLVGRLGEQRG